MEGSAASMPGDAPTAASLRDSEGPQHEIPTDTGARKAASAPSVKRNISSWACESCSSDTSELILEDAAKRESQSTPTLERSTLGSSTAQVVDGTPTKLETCCVPSKLDFFDPNSDLARSPYRGFATLLCP